MSIEGHYLEGSIVLAGSFGEEQGLSPNWAPRTTVMHYDHLGLLRLEPEEQDASPLDVELRHMEAIARADALVMVNHRHAGSLGLDATVEFVWAAMCGTPCFVTHKLQNGLPHRSFAGQYNADELAALGAIGYEWIDLRRLMPEYRRSRRMEPLRPGLLREKAQALPQDDPQFSVLMGICRRLLENLPDIPRHSQASA